MPRRRITTAKQKAASRANLAKGRKIRKGLPTGKTTLLVHQTSKSAASAITRTKTWKDPNGGSPYSSFGRIQNRKEFSIYGDVALTVKVPRKKVKKANPADVAYGISPNELYVKHSDLRGRQVKRLKKGK